MKKRELYFDYNRRYISFNKKWVYLLYQHFVLTYWSVAAMFRVDRNFSTISQIFKC